MIGKHEVPKEFYTYMYFTWLMHQDLGLIVYIKCPFLVLLAFCQKIHCIRNSSIAVYSQLSVWAIHSELFKIIL